MARDDAGSRVAVTLFVSPGAETRGLRYKLFQHFEDLRLRQPTKLYLFDGTVMEADKGRGSHDAEDSGHVRVIHGIDFDDVGVFLGEGIDDGGDASAHTTLGGHKV